jgi:hypothetical protein
MRDGQRYLISVLINQLVRCLEFVTSLIYLLRWARASQLLCDTRGFGFGGSDLGSLGGRFPSQNRADATRIAGCSGYNENFLRSECFSWCSFFATWLIYKT